VRQARRDHPAPDVGSVWWRSGAEDTKRKRDRDRAPGGVAGTEDGLIAPRLEGTVADAPVEVTLLDPVGGTTRKRLFVRLTRVSFGAVAVAGFVGGGKIVTVIKGPPLVFSSMSIMLSVEVPGGPLERRPRASP
jgi:hypothetical protein